MIKLIDILREIKVNKPSPLNALLSLQSKIETSNGPKEQLSLAIQCAEKVLFIFEEKYPNDDRPRKAIEAAKVYLANPTEENRVAAADAADDAGDAADAADAAADAGAAAAYAADANATYGAYDAISAVKKYYNLK